MIIFKKSPLNHNIQLILYKMILISYIYIYTIYTNITHFLQNNFNQKCPEIWLIEQYFNGLSFMILELF